MVLVWMTLILDFELISMEKRMWMDRREKSSV
jgi:hypothetical protein